MSEPRVSAALRRAVAARAGHRCEYCGTREEFSASSFCVERLHVAMDELVAVQVRQRGGERQADAHALGGRKATVTADVGGERAGRVQVRMMNDE